MSLGVSDRVSISAGPGEEDPASVSHVPTGDRSQPPGQETGTFCSPRWLHAWAVLTCAITIIALLTGAIVTTFRVGMADPVWPTYPWHLLVISWQEPSPGFLIEHTHRLADYMVGVCIIVLAVGLWRTERRTWLRRLGWVALVGVIAQGVLGGLRIRLNALVGQDLAFVHGSFAQLVFGLLIGIAVFTSRRWCVGVDETQHDPGQTQGTYRLSLWLCSLVYVQVVLGGLVRHMNARTPARLHLMLAFVVVAMVVWLWQAKSEQRVGRGVLSSQIKMLGFLVMLQVLFGVEAWMIKFGSGVPAELQRVTIGQGVVRTLHFLVGSLIFAASIAIALHAYRLSHPDRFPQGRVRSTSAGEVA